MEALCLLLRWMISLSLLIKVLVHYIIIIKKLIFFVLCDVLSVASLENLVCRCHLAVVLVSK